MRAPSPLVLSSLLLTACATAPAPDIEVLDALRGDTRQVAATGSAASEAVPDRTVTSTLPGFYDTESGPHVLQAGDAGNRPLPIGIGFMLSPSAILFGTAMDFKLDDNLTAGPAVHLAFDDNVFLFAPFGQLKYFPVTDGGNILPFLQGGAGFTYLDRDRRGDDWGFLMNVGGGIRYKTGDSFRLGSTALLNFVPGKVVDDRFYFTWEVIQVVLTF